MLRPRLFAGSRALFRVPRTTSQRRRSATRRAAIETLETRVLLAATALGSETLANATTAGFQALSVGGGRTVAAAPDNSYVSVWSSGDGLGTGVFARRFAVDGTPISGEFAVNSTTAGDQREAAVAVGAGGQFIVAWQSAGQDGAGTAIVARRFDAAGNAVSGEFIVNTTTTGDQTLPAVAFLTGGGYAITWQGPGTGTDIFVRVYDGAGTPVGNDFIVNATTSNGQSAPAISSDGAGGFAVAWQGSGTGDSAGVFFRRFSSTGAALTAELRVNQTTSGTQQSPSIAIRADGSFVVAWSGNGTGDSTGVFARRLTALGATIGNEVRVNQTTSGTQAGPSITAVGNNFTVAWSGGGTGDSSGVFLREFNAGASALAGEVRVNATTPSGQIRPTIATLNGGLVTQWSGNGAGDSAGVFHQRFTNFQFVVNSTLDTVDANPGDGIVADSAGRRTLRAAIMEANALNLPIPVSIALRAGTYSLTRAGRNEDVGSLGDLDVTSRIEIVGAGTSGSATTTIDARQLDRALHVLAGASLSLVKVKVTGGSADGGGFAGGGGVANEGGTVQVADSLITANKATSTTSEFGGGGIGIRQGRAFIRNSTISSNTALGTVVDLDGYGGGLATDVGTFVSIVNTRFDRNSADEGGAIFVYQNTTAEVTGGSITNNTSRSNGGGVAVEFGTLKLTNVGISGNTAPSEGGGLWNFAGNVTVVGGSITGNSSSRSGGGVENTGRITAAIGTMSITGTTISGNESETGGGGDNKRDSVMTITNATIANNHAGEHGGGVANQNEESFGPGHLTITNSLISGNTSGDEGGGLFGLKNITDIVGTTFHGNDAPEGGAVSLGEFTTLTMTDSLVDANTSSHEGGGFYLDKSDLTITDTTFTNNHVVGHGGGIMAFASTVHISGSTFTGNSATGGDGGALENTGRVTQAIGVMTIVDSTFIGNSARVGGGIDNKRDSIMTIDDSIIRENSAEFGGGVGNQNTESFAPGSLTITGTTIADNTATQYGGGVFTIKNSTEIIGSAIEGNSAHEGGGIANIDAATLVVRDSQVTGNHVDNEGAGITNELASVTIIASNVSGNTSDDVGGGLFNFAGQVDVSDSTFAGNSAGFSGGGIENTGKPGVYGIGVLTVSGSTFSDNAAGRGGAITNRRGGSATIVNSTLSGNQSDTLGGGIYNTENSTTSLTNDTIAFNTAQTGGGIANESGTVSIANTIVAKNTAATNPDVSGAFSSAQSNLIGIVGSATGLANAVNGNIVGTSASPVDPLLGDLQDNGGPTHTHALLAGSDAIDAGSNSAASAAGLSTDQRGSDRVVDSDENGSAITDIGAFELDPLDTLFATTGLGGVFGG